MTPFLVGFLRNALFLDMRFLHTADWQIGMRAEQVAEVADTVREARLTSARRVIELARTEAVDFVLLAGDTFEDNHVDGSLIRSVAEILQAAPCPVFVLPGNHDPLTADSVYHRSEWPADSETLRLLETTEPVAVAGGWLLPAPVFQKRSMVDPTKAMARPPEGGPIVGVAHGSLAIESRHEIDDHPIGLDVIERQGLDYLALGHWHGRYVQKGRIVYPGTHETTKFGEKNSGNVMVVTIEGRGEMPDLVCRPTSTLTWDMREIDLNRGPAQVRSELEVLVDPTLDPRRILLRLKTHGACDEAVDGALGEWIEIQRSRLLHLDVIREDTPTLGAESRLRELVDSSDLVTGLLEDLEALTPDDQTPPEVIEEARRLLLGWVLEMGS